MKKTRDWKFAPEDTDKLIHDFGKPLSEDRKSELMKKLEARREAFIKARLGDRSYSQERDLGRPNSEGLSR